MTVADKTRPEFEDAHMKEPHEVTIVVNGSPVVLPQGKYTGRQIKEAAIAQGVPDIAPNFVLSVQRGNHYDVVGDDDRIQIHPNLDFVAVTGDDNS